MMCDKCWKSKVELENKEGDESEWKKIKIYDESDIKEEWYK